MTCSLRMLVAQVANGSSGRRVVDQIETATEYSSANPAIRVPFCFGPQYASYLPPSNYAYVLIEGWREAVSELIAAFLLMYL